MNMNIIFGVFIGGIAGVIFCLIVGAVIFLIRMMIMAKYNRIIRVNVVTAGRIVAEWHKGYLIKHKTLGECYVVPKLHRENRKFINYFGSKYEYPTNKSRIKYVPVTYYQNVYVPEEYESLEQRDMETIEYNKTTKKYEKLISSVTCSIVTPVKNSMRQFNLAADKAIQEEYNIPVGFFERNKAVILALGMLFITGAVCALIIIFTYQSAADGMFNQMPDWARPLVDGMTTLVQNQAPPPTGAELAP